MCTERNPAKTLDCAASHVLRATNLLERSGFRRCAPPSKTLERHFSSTRRVGRNGTFESARICRQYRALSMTSAKAFGACAARSVLMLPGHLRVSASKPEVFDEPFGENNVPGRLT